MKVIKQVKNGSDEYVVEHIAKYLKPKSKILCPFDKAESNFVKVLLKYDHNVVYSHIDDGIDFFNLNDVKRFDYIISNPPFSLKNEILNKLYEMKIPFAMLLPLGAIETKKRQKNFREKGVELLLFDERIIYINGNNSPNFNSGFFCWNVLPEKLILEEIDKVKRDEVKKCLNTK